jgi:small-conductance mechanosensitive channel
VFKHLLFFRASVRNNSVIDNVLESTINGIYYFVMSLLLLSFMEINPWPLLVSLTSLLVSVSFALGSSVSKYVEVRKVHF